MTRIKNGDTGFTLIEAVIAVLILTVALVGAASMQTRAVDGSNSASRMTDRVRGVEQRMEEIMSRPICAKEGTAADEIFSTDNATEALSCASYKIKYRVIPDAPLKNLTTIDVTAVPAGVDAKKKKTGLITFSCIRSAKWN
jgi:Tfp pilus assembly protein PilV